MAGDVRRWILAPLAWLALVLPPVAVWTAADIDAWTNPYIAPERAVSVTGTVAADDRGRPAVRFRYTHPVTDQEVRVDVQVGEAAVRPAPGSTVGAIVDRDNPDRVQLVDARGPLWAALVEYLWLPLLPLGASAARLVHARAVHRLQADDRPTFAMLATVTPPPVGVRGRLHLYPLDARPGTRALCSVPLLSAVGWPRDPLQVEVKGSPRAFGRVVARHGSEVLWPIRRAAPPRGDSLPARPAVPAVGGSRHRPQRLPVLCDLTPLAVLAVASAALLVLVGIQLAVGAKSAAAAYASGPRVLAEVTEADPDGFELAVRYRDSDGTTRQARAPVDWPEDYTAGRRYPAVVVLDRAATVRLLAEPYDVVEPLVWAGLPAGTAAALLLRRRVYRPPARGRREAPAGAARERSGPRGRRAGGGQVVEHRLAAAGLVLLAVVLTFGAVEAWGKTEDVLQRGVVVTGEVIDVHNVRVPRIEVTYRTADGTTITQDTVNFTGDYEVGDPVDVVYDPLQPHLMEAADWGTDHTTAYALGVAATVAAFLAAGRFRAARR